MHAPGACKRGGAGGGHFKARPKRVESRAPPPDGAGVGRPRMTDIALPTAAPPARPPRLPRLLTGALVVAVTVLAYVRVVGHEFLDWDDWTAIRQNPRLNPPTLSALKYYWTDFNPHEEFYVPVNYTAWWLVAQVAQVRDPAGTLSLSPAPFHALNLASHTLNALLVLVILRRLAPWEPASVVGALLFALHPVQAEPVAWASSMYSALSGTFSLLAVLEFMRFSDLLRPKDETGQDPGPQTSNRLARAWTHYVLATLSFLLAMHTKPSVVTVPLIVAAIEFGLRGRGARGLILPIGAWLVLVAPAVLLARASQADAPVYHVPAYLRPVVALDALAFYLGKLVAPVGLSPDYGRSPHWLLTGLRGQLYVTWIVPVALLIACAALWRRARWPLACAALFVAALLPSLGLMPFDYQRYSTVADRYLYLAMLAPAIAVAVVLSRHPCQGALVLAAVVVAILGVMSFRQTRHWSNTTTLFSHALSVNPRSLAAHSVFGYRYAQRGNDDLALGEYKLALEANPGDARVLVLMGNLFARQGRLSDAEAAYTQALPRKPHDAALRVSLGVVLTRQQRFQEARTVLGEALDLAPNSPLVNARLGAVCMMMQDWAAARRHFEATLRASPNDPEALRGLAALREIGQ